jgi:hypothetical protein
VIRVCLTDFRFFVGRLTQPAVDFAAADEKKFSAFSQPIQQRESGRRIELNSGLRILQEGSWLSVSRRVNDEIRRRKLCAKACI